jgi:hypothetical protein
MTIGDWDQRMLCPDGACVGVIGPDGTCKVCGRVAPNWGDERKRGLLPLEPDADENENEDEITHGAEDLAEPDRELCSDGSCIGVIGPDGTCKECGRPGTRPARAADADGDDDADDADDADEDEYDDPDDDGDDERVLCPDGACIGVIGPDGRCKVCGTEAS